MGFSRQEYWSGVPLPSPHLKEPVGKTSPEGLHQKNVIINQALIIMKYVAETTNKPHINTNS